MLKSLKHVFIRGAGGVNPCPLLKPSRISQNWSGWTIDHLSMQIDLAAGFHGIVGKSDIMRKVYQVIEKAAQSDPPVIIFG